MSESITIWDINGAPPFQDRFTLLWRGYYGEKKENLLSVPHLVEQNSEALRARYLAWIYELSKLCVNGKSAVDSLSFRNGFSYWWMLNLIESDADKAPFIYDIIRLFAVTDWIVKRNTTQILLMSESSVLTKCLRDWCADLGLTFNSQRPSLSNTVFSWPRLKNPIWPAMVSALWWLLRYLRERWALRGVGLSGWRSTISSTTFVSYFSNLVPEAIREGRYESRYWGPLPGVLRSAEHSTNWLHLYVGDNTVSDKDTVPEIIRRLNENSCRSEVHVTLDSFISLNVVRRALANWIRLAWSGKRLETALARARETSLNLWPFISKDWRLSTRGVRGMSNALNEALLFTALKTLRKQNIGFYLQENQGWENALIQNWKLAGHQCLIGIPHTFVKFWDLRYFRDARMYRSSKDSMAPLPDYVGVNGNAALSAYLTGGFPPSRLIQLEALRYMHLRKKITQKISEPRTMKKIDRLLTITDHMEVNTRYQLDLLDDAIRRSRVDISITVKPHPLHRVSVREYPRLKLKIQDDDLSTLLSHYDVIYAANATAAAIDAYLSGLIVIVLNNPSTLNLSPLRGHDDVYFVHSSKELGDILLLLRNGTKLNLRDNISSSKIFNLEPHLPRWKNIIEQNFKSNEYNFE